MFEAATLHGLVTIPAPHVVTAMDGTAQDLLLLYRACRRKRITYV